MEQDIEIDGLRLHYSVSGPEGGAPVVLMHGYLCNHTTVASIARALSDGMRVYSLDLPGHGQSQEPPAHWGDEEYADCIEHFIQKLSLERPSLIGHSFGGRVSIGVSSRKECNIRKVMLVDSAGVKPRRPLKYYLKVYSFKASKWLALHLLGKKRSQPVVERLRNRFGSADYRQSSPVMKQIMSRCTNHDLRPLMPFIKAPTLLVWGEEDTATPLSDAKVMEQLIPDAGIVSFPGCGHYSFLDNPAGFTAVAREFFKKEIADGLKSASPQ